MLPKLLLIENRNNSSDRKRYYLLVSREIHCTVCGTHSFMFMFCICDFGYRFMQAVTGRTFYGSRLRNRTTVIPPAGEISHIDTSSDDETDTDTNDVNFKASGRCLEVEESLSGEETDLPRKEGHLIKERESRDGKRRVLTMTSELQIRRSLSNEDFTPLQYFMMYVDDEFLENVVYETNLYST